MGWTYRNGVKALAEQRMVADLVADPQNWGFFVPRKGCMPSPGVYVCGGRTNATSNLYGYVNEQGFAEYVFNHRNASLRGWLVDTYFFGASGGGDPNVRGFYVDDSWSSKGPSEMPYKPDFPGQAVAEMGLTPEDVAAHTAAWEANQQAWRDALVARGLFEWYLFYGGQQYAVGWDGTDPKRTCAGFMRANCGAGAPTQNGTLFFGFSRVSHHVAWLPNGSLPHAEQDIAAFQIVRGPYAYIGYGFVGTYSLRPGGSHYRPFTRPAALDAEYGEPAGFCEETAPGVFQREWTAATVALDCNTFRASTTQKGARPARTGGAGHRTEHVT